MGTVTDLGVTPKPEPQFHRFLIRMSDGMSEVRNGCSYVIGFAAENDLAILDENGAVVQHFMPHAAVSIRGERITKAEHKRTKNRLQLWIET